MSLAGRRMRTSGGRSSSVRMKYSVSPEFSSPSRSCQRDAIRAVVLDRQRAVERLARCAVERRGGVPSLSMSGGLRDRLVGVTRRAEPWCRRDRRCRRCLRRFAESRPSPLRELVMQVDALDARRAHDGDAEVGRARHGGTDVIVERSRDLVQGDGKRPGVGGQASCELSRDSLADGDGEGRDQLARRAPDARSDGDAARPLAAWWSRA